MKNKYVKKVFEEVVKKNEGETQYINTVKEVFTSLEPVYNKNPELEKYAYLERLAEPQRVIEFQVKWKDDNGKIQVNRGYRVQYNSALGPYKGGLRLHPSVNLSIIKFLGFEQIFKNSLTTLPMGGGNDEQDFRGESER